MMTNNAQRIHQSRFRAAFDLWKSDDEFGKGALSEACLRAVEILFELRMTPDLNLFLRARVNELLASITVFEQDKYDSEKFAREAARLCQELRLRIAGRGEVMSEVDDKKVKHVESNIEKMTDIIVNLKRFLRENGDTRIFPEFVLAYDELGNALQIGGSFCSRATTTTTRKLWRTNLASITANATTPAMPRTSQWLPRAILASIIANLKIATKPMTKKMWAAAHSADRTL